MGNPATILAIAAERAAWTHCLHGHEFTPENTYRDARGRRRCGECHRAGDRERRRIKRTQIAKETDGIIDEVAIERASHGDVTVFTALTRAEYMRLVDLIDEGLLPCPPFKTLRETVRMRTQRRKEIE